MARNEADVVEAFVRHNLTVLDGLTVIDHRSNDATPRILAALRDEGLPLVLGADERIGLLQDEVMTAAARAALGEHGADWVFALDADEFLRVPSRERLERVLAGLPPRMHAALRWQTYVPDFSVAADDVVAVARTARRLETERHGAFKVIVARHLLDTPEALIIPGSHSVFPRRGMPRGTTAPQAVLPAEVAALAHLPIRSRRQFVAKVAVKWLARVAAGRPYKPDIQTVAAYTAIRQGETLSDAFLLDQAVNWTVVGERRLPPERVALVADPFLADVELRHTPPSVSDPLVHVLAAAEEMASELARMRRQETPPAGSQSRSAHDEERGR
jgi:hypothetical protein